MVLLSWSVFPWIYLLPESFFCVPLGRLQPCRSALRPGQERALMRGICNWSPLPGEWCHHDWDGQLWPDRWQDLRRWPVPDGERQLLPTRCLQDYITKVKRGGAEGSHSRAWQGAEDASYWQTHKKTQKCLHSPCFYSHLHTGEPDTFFFVVPALLHQVDDVGGVLMLRKLGRILILDRQELTSMSGSSSRQLRFVWLIISGAWRLRVTPTSS